MKKLFKDKRVIKFAGALIGLCFLASLMFSMIALQATEGGSDAPLFFQVFITLLAAPFWIVVAIGDTIGDIQGLFSPALFFVGLMVTYIWSLVIVSLFDFAARRLRTKKYDWIEMILLYGILMLVISVVVTIGISVF